LFTVIVNLDVLPERVEEFLAGIQTNARSSIRDEPGCLRFDVHRSLDDPLHFMFYEIYRDETAFYDEHRSAPHYANWREVVARCVRPGSQVNTYCAPAFPNDVPERPVQEQP
jgi:autoinducer 2-degrading protein